MKKVYVQIEYKDNVYLSDEVEMNETELNKLETDVIKSVSGQVESFAIKQGNNELYFGAEILKKSVITIIEVK